jgi:DNA-binding LacI/PurR family transcriptional regulator
MLDQADAATGPHPTRDTVIVFDDHTALGYPHTAAGVIAVSKSRLLYPGQQVRVAVVDNATAHEYQDAAVAHIALIGDTADAAHTAASLLHTLLDDNPHHSSRDAAATVTALTRHVHTPSL